MMAVRLPVQDTIYFTPPLLLLYHCSWVLMGDWGIGWEIGGSIHCTQKKNTHACAPTPTNTHTHTLNSSKGPKGSSLGRGSERKRREEEKRGGVKVDLSAACSHPVVTMGHPLLRWQWEWQAYLCGRWRAVTDWTDRAVGGCVEVTGFISIWVKNLANVANMAAWVRGGGKGTTWPRPRLSAVCLLFGQYTFQSNPSPQFPLSLICPYGLCLWVLQIGRRVETFNKKKKK